MTNSQNTPTQSQNSANEFKNDQTRPIEDDNESTSTQEEEISVASADENGVIYFKDYNLEKDPPQVHTLPVDITDYTQETDNSNSLCKKRQYLAADQVEEMIHAAYIRGKNEAIRAQIDNDASILAHKQCNDDILFSTRQSVWTNA